MQDSTHNTGQKGENKSERILETELETNVPKTASNDDEQVILVEIEEDNESETISELTGVSAIQNNESIIELEHIDFSNDMSLYEAIDTRVATRNFVDREVDFEIVTKILWAAHGMTYSGGEKTINGLDAITSATEVPRYAISPASSERYINVYYIAEDGAYEYVPEDHTLVKRTDKNLLNEGSTAGNNRQIRILFTIDKDSYSNDDIWAYLTIGSCMQNVNLVANAEGLHVFSEGWFSHDGLAEGLDLKDNEEQAMLLSLGHIE